MKQMKRAIAAILIISSVVVMTGCSIFDSRINDIKGKLSGNSYSCYFYDNNGEKFLTVTGQKIGLTSNVVEEGQIDSSDGSYSTSYGLSSIVTLNVDGQQMESCGDTIIFEEKGLSPDAEFTLSDINSKSNGKISDNAIISNVINKYKNQFGKSQVVVIQSQLGVPICAYSGEKVYWEVREDLPKTTKLMVDGKALYIHRANFQIIDRDLIQ